MPSIRGLASALLALQLSTRDFNTRFQYALERKYDNWGDSEERQYQRSIELEENNG